MAKILSVDFSGVESSGRVRVPEDDYRVRVDAVKQQESKAGNQMLVWDFEITKGKFAGKKLRDRTVLTKESLWKLKQVLEAMGVSVPSKKVALNITKYIGMELGVTVVDDEYEGRINSKVADYVSLDVLDNVPDGDEDEDEDEDEEPVAKKSKKGKKGKKSKKAEEDDEDEDIEELDLDEM
jgi:hypothetical protein